MNTTAQGFYLDTNEDSWRWVSQEIDGYPDTEYWIGYKGFAKPLIAAAMDAGLHHHFRVGFSMEHIIFSTADKRLELYEPPIARVTLMAGRASKLIGWSHHNLHFHEPERTQIVNAENALVVLKAFLADLWRETRSNEEVPGVLTI